MMNSVRKYIAYLLVLTLPLSAWASGGMPCASSSAPETVISSTSSDDPHAHHRSVDHPASHGEHETMAAHAGHQMTPNDESTPVDCPCCDDCATACVSSGCSLVALATASDVMMFTSSDRHLPSADAFLDGPPPHVLFRPPIFSV
jgi:hypothetical protein